MGQQRLASADPVLEGAEASLTGEQHLGLKYLVVWLPSLKCSMTPPATPDLGFPIFGGGPGGRLGRVGEGDIEGEEFWGENCLAPK